MATYETRADQLSAEERRQNELLRTESQKKLISDLEALLAMEEADANFIFAKLIELNFKFEENFRNKTVEEIKEAIVEVISELKKNLTGIPNISSNGAHREEYLGGQLGEGSIKAERRDVSLLYDEGSVLTSQEYHVPQSILSSHNDIVKGILKKGDLTGLAYNGLLLVSRPGEGKSEYARALTGALGNKGFLAIAKMHQLTDDSLGGESNLFNLYRTLETRAQQDGTVAVLLLDEFGGVINSTQHTTELKVVNAATEETHSLTGDHKTGEQKSLFEILKTCLSGGTSYPHVFTIITSNDLDDKNPSVNAIARPGRLERVVLRTVHEIGNLSGLDIVFSSEKKEPLRGTPMPYSVSSSQVDFSQVPEFLRELADVIKVQYYRQENRESDLVENLRKGIEEVANSVTFEKGNVRWIRGERKPRNFTFTEYRNNYKIIDNLLKYLGFDYTQLPDEFKCRFYLYAEEYNLVSASSAWPGKRFPEVIHMNTLTGAHIMKFVKKNLCEGQSIEEVKKSLAKFLFPQLKDVE